MAASNNNFISASASLAAGGAADRLQSRTTMAPSTRTSGVQRGSKFQFSLADSSEKRTQAAYVMFAFILLLFVGDSFVFVTDFQHCKEYFTDLVIRSWSNVGTMDCTFVAITVVALIVRQLKQSAGDGPRAGGEKGSGVQRRNAVGPRNLSSSSQRGFPSASREREENCNSSGSHGRKAEGRTTDDSGYESVKTGDHKQLGALHAKQGLLARCNQAIDQAARQGDPAKAGKLLLELEQTGIKTDIVSYNLVIRAHAKKGDIAAAERWLTRMEEVGVAATLCTYNTILDACVKADNAEACEMWLERMLQKGIEPNVITYATVIYARARRGQEKKAEEWLRRMSDAGIEPDAVSYNSMIHACGVSGNSHGAERWIQEMKSRGLAATVTTYTTAIDACAKSGNLGGAERCMETMLADGVQPNVVTFSALIDTCAKSANLARAEYWHDRLVESNIQPNAHTYSAVINACAKAGNVEAAERWLNKSEEAGIVGDVVVYSSMIDACGKVGDAERATTVFQRMKAAGIRPHIVAYAALARPYAYRGDWGKVDSIASEMAADGVQPNEYFVYAQMLAYASARPRQAKRAEVCFRQAMSAGIAANDHIVGVLTRSVGRQRCQELLEELGDNRHTAQQPSRAGRRTRTPLRTLKGPLLG